MLYFVNWINAALLKSAKIQKKIIEEYQFRWPSQFWTVPYYVYLQNTTFSFKPIHFFDKIKLILDTPGLNKKNWADIKF